VSDPLTGTLWPSAGFAGFPHRSANKTEQPARVYVLTRRPGHLFAAQTS